MWVYGSEQLWTIPPYSLYECNTTTCPSTIALHLFLALKVQTWECGFRSSLYQLDNIHILQPLTLPLTWTVTRWGQYPSNTTTATICLRALPLPWGLGPVARVHGISWHKSLSGDSKIWKFYMGSFKIREIRVPVGVP